MELTMGEYNPGEWSPAWTGLSCTGGLFVFIIYLFIMNRGNCRNLSHFLF